MGEDRILKTLLIAKRRYESDLDLKNNLKLKLEYQQICNAINSWRKCLEPTGGK